VCDVIDVVAELMVSTASPVPASDRDVIDVVAEFMVSTASSVPPSDRDVPACALITRFIRAATSGWSTTRHWLYYHRCADRSPHVGVAVRTALAVGKG
jgi:hypothetical protein